MSVQAFMDAVRRSPTAFHAAQTALEALLDAGYEPLAEGEDWQLRPGGHYVVTRNRSAVVAFALPRQGGDHFQLIASHSDSPMFKLKPRFTQQGEHYTLLNVEPYGGMIMSTWLDRPLAVAGRLLLRTEQGFRTELVDLGRDALVIPNQPIHFNRDINKGYAYNPQEDLLPLWGDGEAGALLAELAAGCGASEDQVAGYDLYLYNRMPGTVWGAAGEYFSSPRIDDLECAWTSLQAMLRVPEAESIRVWALLDNEEVGSGSKQGADSTLLGDVLCRIGGCLGWTDSQCRTAIARSFLVSADNAHAVHPTHPEKYDPENRVWMNGGVVIKHSANQKYTTDGVSSALFSEICSGAGVPVQHFANRSNVQGGSTLGRIAVAHVSMNSVDIGLAQLAMHSSWETAGTRDIDAMTDALAAYYAAPLRMTADGAWAWR